MNRNFKPQIEILEERKVLNAAWHEMVILGDVAAAPPPSPSLEVVVSSDSGDNAAMGGTIDVPWHVISRGSGSTQADVRVPIVGAANETGEHEVGHWLGLGSQAPETRAICHGTTVLAWARVDGVSPGWGSSSYQYAFEGTHGNAAIGSDSLVSGSDGQAAADDVIVDGKIITAENYDSARREVNDIYIFQSPN